jgi:hypothetical protein
MRLPITPTVFTNRVDALFQQVALGDLNSQARSA